MSFPHCQPFVCTDDKLKLSSSSIKVVLVGRDATPQELPASFGNATLCNSSCSSLEGNLLFRAFLLFCALFLSFSLFRLCFSLNSADRSLFFSNVFISPAVCCASLFLIAALRSLLVLLYSFLFLGAIIKPEYLSCPYKVYLKLKEQSWVH